MMRIGFRGLALGVALFLAVAVFFSYGGGSEVEAAGAKAKERAVLNLYNWAEYMPESIIKGFEQEFGAKVNYDTFSNNEEMLAKLQAGASGYDLIFPSDYMVQVMANLKLLQPLDKAKLKNWKNLGKDWLDLYFDKGNKYSVPYLWGTLGIAYNSLKVKKAITSWNDLWDDKYKGRIVLPNDSREVIGAILQSCGFSRNSTNKKELQRAKAEFKKLMPLVKVFDTDSPKTLLMSGEVWIGMVWSGEAALANQENPKIKYVIPKEGGGIFMDNICIPKSAPHKELAHKFIDYVLRPEVSAQLSEAFPYGNPNAASHALTSKKIMSNPASYPPKASIAKAEWLKDVGDFTTEYDRIWTEVKGQ